MTAGALPQEVNGRSGGKLAPEAKGRSLSVAMPYRLTYTWSARRASNLSGIAAMLAATASFVVGDSFIKLLTENLPPFEVLFLRGVAASLACAMLVALRGEWRALSPAPSTAARWSGQPLRRLALCAMLWPSLECLSPT